MQNISAAPVAMFVYNRMDTVKKTIACLLANTLASQTELFVFSDGGKDEKSWGEVKAVRDYIRSIPPSGLKKVTLIERPENYYLERNITDGVTTILAQYECAIFLEDDICTAPYFLEYMNDALSFYKDKKQVMHIAGFTPLNLPHKGDVYFTSHMSGWGWATWADRWNSHFVHFTSRAEGLEGMTGEMISHIEYGGVFPCLNSLDRNPIPWDICWDIAIHKNKGLCLSPTQSLVYNCGIQGGTHFHSQKLFGKYDYDRPFITRKLNVEKSDIEEDDEIETVIYPEAFRDFGFRYNLLGKIVRFFYHLISSKKS
jgi:hypothetical protein